MFHLQLHFDILTRKVYVSKTFWRMNLGRISKTQQPYDEFLKAEALLLLPGWDILFVVLPSSFLKKSILCSLLYCSRVNVANRYHYSSKSAYRMRQRGNVNVWNSYFLSRQKGSRYYIVLGIILTYYGNLQIFIYLTPLCVSI